MVKSKKETLTPRHRASLAKTRLLSKVLTLPASSAPSSASSTNIKVVVRVRPANGKEQDDNYRNVVSVIDEQTLVFDPKEIEQPFFYHGVQQKNRNVMKRTNKDITFVFDKIFNSCSTNDEVFQNSTQTLIDALMNGYNCSVFAYGATGAGKTFTMIGSTESPGITYLTMKGLFARKEELSGDREFELMLTYIEVYNELVKDLLNPGPPLNLREDSKYGVMIAGVKGYKISNPDDLFTLLEQGNRMRTQHATDANAESSRSHAVFQVYIQMTMKMTKEVRRAKLSMIDLAGSERGSATGFQGARFKEGANINKSLLALGNCINSLADSHKHIPYRDSKLTRLLKDSLGGNCHTVMIANVSPSSLSFDDTYNTLKYATRAKSIKSSLKRNVVSMDVRAEQYVQLVETLKSENNTLKSENTGLKKQIEELRAQLAQIPAAEGVPRIVVDEAPPVAQEASREVLGEFQMLVEKNKEVLEREFQIRSTELGMSIRRKLKEEANRRISHLFLSEADKVEVHRKITCVVERFVRKEEVTKNELLLIQTTKRQIQDDIGRLLGRYSELNLAAADADRQFALLEANYREALGEKKFKILEEDYRAKLGILGKMSCLLRTLYLSSLGRGETTETMKQQFEELLSDIQDVKHMGWEDLAGDSGVSSTVSLQESEHTPRASKRKIEQEDTLESTFVVALSPKPTPAKAVKAEPTNVRRVITKGGRNAIPLSPKNKENRPNRKPQVISRGLTFAKAAADKKPPLKRPAFRS